MVREHSSRGPAAAILTTMIAHDTAHVAQIASAPEVRGRGYGAALLDAACTAAAARGAGRLSLLVADDNVPARALYESRGFVPAGSFCFAHRPRITRVT